MRPSVILRDVDLIKDVLYNFDCFGENDVALSRKYDQLTATNPFFLTDDEWRESRKTILPAFTSSKVRFCDSDNASDAFNIFIFS